MKELKKQFDGIGEVKGYKFTQICKTSKGFLYEVSSGGVITHYEVFKRKINTRFDCESYPSSKAFGVWAWTYKNKELAESKLNQL
jgi:hypothetical protein